MSLAVLSFGGGLNSTALLLGLLERGSPPDAILFADTGAEHPETYQHLDQVDGILAAEGLDLRVERISNADRDDAPHASLEEECLTNKTLPSLAFGFAGCSAKWKRQPMDRWIRVWEPAVAAWSRGEKVERLLGIDAGEAHRSQALVDAEDRRYLYRRPLVEWGWDRDACRDAVERAGLEVPRKSACFFCPASRKSEVLALAAERPELYERAVALERNAREAGGLLAIEGLGRRWSWERLVEADRAQLRLFPEAPESACGCYDGDREDG